MKKYLRSLVLSPCLSKCKIHFSNAWHVFTSFLTGPKIILIKIIVFHSCQHTALLSLNCCFWILKSYSINSNQNGVNLHIKAVSCLHDSWVSMRYCTRKFLCYLHKYYLLHFQFISSIIGIANPHSTFCSLLYLGLPLFFLTNTVGYFYTWYRWDDICRHHFLLCETCLLV